MPTLPLFPLNTVLFPGATLPLQVFEPRYRQMVRECLDADRRLGVVLIRSGREVGGRAVPRAVGTVGLIEEVGDMEAAIFPVRAVGGRRFRILQLDRSRAYLRGEVDLLDEPSSEGVDAAALGVARRTMLRYARALLLLRREEWRRRPELPGGPSELGYRMGEALLDQPGQAQLVLEAGTVTERLQLATPAVEIAAGRLEAQILAVMARDGRRGLARN